MPDEQATPGLSERTASSAPDTNPRPKARQLIGHPLVQLTITRWREFTREPEAMFWVFIFPLLLACALGIAFRNTAPEKIRIGIEDDGGDSAALTEIRTTLERSPDLNPVTFNPAGAARALRTGNVALVVRKADNESQGSLAPQSPATSGDQNISGADPQLVYRFDPTRPESRLARLAVDDAFRRANGRVDEVKARAETVMEPGARYIDFLIPGLLGLNLMGSGMWGIGFGIVSARGRKLLKRFAATPMRRSHYLLSFMFSRLIFLALEVAALVGFARLAFGVIVHGSHLDVAVCALAGALSFSGLGLLVSSRTRTVEGVSGLMNFVLLPMWLLSGTFFSAARFPALLQPFIKVLPLTALNDSFRAVINEGVSVTTQWPQILILLLWGLVSFAVALKIFRWQ